MAMVPSLQRLQRLFASELQTEESTTAASLPHNCQKIDSYVSEPYSAPRNTAKYRGIVEGAKPRSPASKIERCVIASFQIAESIGFKGDFRKWKELLRVGDWTL